MKNKVKGLRKAKGLTQPELAKALGVSLATIQNWEAEKNDMTGWSLKLLCDFFGVTPDEVYGTGKPSKSLSGESELVSIYRSINDSGKYALLAAARGLACSYEEKNNPSSGNGEAIV